MCEIVSSRDVSTAASDRPEAAVGQTGPEAALVAPHICVGQTRPQAAYKTTPAVPEFIDPVFSHRKPAFWACFRENWVYRFGLAAVEQTFSGTNY